LIWGSNSCRERGYVLQQNFQTDFGFHPFNGHQGFFPGLISPERKVNISPSSSTEAKNKWNYNSAVPTAFISWIATN